MHSTTMTDTTQWVSGGSLSRHEQYALQVAALREEAQRRVDTRLAQGFSAEEALAYAAPLVRAARRGRVLQATCLLELASQRID